MKNFFNSLLDFLHSYVDIFVMGGIIIIIVLTINWRLNALFTENAGDVHANKGSSHGEVLEPNVPLVDDIPDEEPDENPEDENPVEPTDNEATPEVGNETILVEVPAGSTSTKIGEILSSQGLVTNSKEFVTRAVEMSLDRKLQSGNFKIPKNSSLDDMVKIISKQI